MFPEMCAFASNLCRNELLSDCTQFVTDSYPLQELALSMHV